LKNRSKVQGKKNIKRRAQTSKNKDSAIYFTQNSTEIFKKNVNSMIMELK